MSSSALGPALHDVGGSFWRSWSSRGEGRGDERVSDGVGARAETRGGGRRRREGRDGEIDDFVFSLLARRSLASFSSTRDRRAREGENLRARRRRRDVRAPATPCKCVWTPSRCRLSKGFVCVSRVACVRGRVCRRRARASEFVVFVPRGRRDLTRPFHLFSRIEEKSVRPTTRFQKRASSSLKDDALKGVSRSLRCETL